MADQDSYTTRVVSVELIRYLGHYQGKAALILGVFQIILGLWSIALGIAHTLTESLLFGDVGYGIWGGVVYIIAGVCGILSKTKKPEWIVTHMVMCIMAALLASLQFCLAVCSAYYDHDPERLVGVKKSTPYAGTVVVDSLLAVAGISEAIVAIAAAAIGCKVTCCNNSFMAAQQELDNPKVRSYDITESYKYIVNPSRS